MGENFMIITNVAVGTGPSVVDDGGEGFGVEAGPAYQGAVDFFFGHQGFGVFGFYGASVEDAELVGEFVAEGFGGFVADDGVGFGGQLRSGGLSGSDGPDGFVGYDQLFGLLGGDFVEGAGALAAEDVFGEIGFALFEDFSDADDGGEAGFEGGFQAEVYGVVGFAEVLAALGVSDEGVGAPMASEACR